ncbi:MAG: DUF6894 family protein [Janthinobacterium lividum]
MMLLFIHATDTEFFSCDEGAEYDQPADALAEGVRSAVALLADEINQGGRSAAIEISVQLEDGTQLLRSVVSVAVSPLLPILPGSKQRTFQLPA